MLTSQAEVPCCSIFSASMAAYFMGCHIKKAPPKQALKVASGSVTPISVPATCTPPECHISEGTQHEQNHRAQQCSLSHQLSPYPI